jgi:predicted amidohydrolase
MAKINICSLQLNLKDSDNFEKISSEVDKVLSEGEQTHMIVLSELAVSGVKPDEEKSLTTFLPLFSDLAKKYDTWLIPGTFHEFEDDVIYNTCPVINNKGELVAKARKLYPWLPYENQITPGNEICTFEYPGSGIIGVHICYDLWFPETSRALAMAGAELIINPTLTPTQDREIETVMVRATAAQQQCYYVDVNSVGEQGCGQSIACDPEGNVLHASDDQEDIFTVEVDFDFVRNSRKNGIMGLGQNLKSYRDNPFSSMIKEKRNNNYLESLGALTQLKKEDDQKF